MPLYKLFPRTRTASPRLAHVSGAFHEDLVGDVAGSKGHWASVLVTSIVMTRMICQISNLTPCRVLLENTTYLHVCPVFRPNSVR